MKTISDISTRYESVIISPDSDVGYKALHEHVQDGWEPLVAWHELHTYMVGTGYTWTNKIILRRRVHVETES